MPTIYRLFGLTVAASHPLPGLPEMDGNAPVDVTVDLANHLPAIDPIPTEETIRYRAEFAPESEVPALTVWRRLKDGRMRLRYEDGTQFLVDAAATRIRAMWPAPLTLEDAAVYLLGPVMGLVLRLRGIVCLHASAVAIEDRAVAFMAPAGSGKSTLAASFAINGVAVLSDDVLAVERSGSRFSVRPAYPMIRLWPPAVPQVLPSKEPLPRLSPRHPTWDKGYVNLCAVPYRFQEDPLPLAAIYIGTPTAEEILPRIESLSSPEALLAFVGNSYGWYLLDGKMRAREFDFLSILSDRVPVRRIRARSWEDCPPAQLRRMVHEDFLRIGKMRR